VWDGVIDNNVSSKWGKAEWEKFFQYDGLLNHNLADHVGPKSSFDAGVQAGNDWDGMAMQALRMTYPRCRDTSNPCLLF
jgi:hypothetical protein